MSTNKIGLDPIVVPEKALDALSLILGLDVDIDDALAETIRGLRSNQAHESWEQIHRLVRMYIDRAKAETQLAECLLVLSARNAGLILPRDQEPS